jgi:putative transposase
MTWRDTCPMDEKAAFVEEVLRGERTMSELCRVFQISRKTGYKLWHRYQELGEAGLREQSRAPHHHPNAVDPKARELLLAARRRNKDWGPKKLLHWMKINHPRVERPAISTAAEILRRSGLVKPRSNKRRSVPYGAPFTQAQAPNDLWSADYKGQFRTGDGLYCYPLTMSDAASRYFLCCRGLLGPTLEATRPWIERAFRTYGLPSALRTDNGQPFASTAIGGLTQLSLWFLKLGIRHERIRPGCPQQNGRHERMHRTLKEGCAIEADLQAQQRSFNRYLKLYNNERPHDALDGQTPASRYQSAPREYPRRVPDLEYDEGLAVRYIRESGQFNWRGREWYVSHILAGEPIGLKPVDNGVWLIYVGPLAIGRLDLRCKKVQRIETYIEVQTLH